MIAGTFYFDLAFFVTVLVGGLCAGLFIGYRSGKRDEQERVMRQVQKRMRESR